MCYRCSKGRVHYRGASEADFRVETEVLAHLMEPGVLESYAPASTVSSEAETEIASFATGWTRRPVS